MRFLQRFQSGAEDTARWLVVMSAFAVMMPTAWISVSTALFLLAWLAAGQYGKRLAFIRQNPVAWPSAILLMWMALSIAWSPADPKAAADGFWHYRELLIIPLMLSVVRDRTWGMRTLVALMAGLAVALAVSWLRWLGLLAPYEGGGIYAGFVGHTGFSLALAFGTYASFWLWRAARSSQRPVWLVLGLLCVINLFFINTGRTGQVAFLGLLPLLLFRWVRWKGLVMGALLGAALAVGLFFGSSSVHDRSLQTIQDVRGFRAGHTDSNDGIRMEFWVTTWDLIRSHPVFGGGAGSFAAEYREVAQARGWTGIHVAENPHNEYLMVWSQFGVVGLILLLWLWMAQWRRAAGEDETNRYLTHGLLILFAIGCLFNSLILDNMEGHFYALLTVALSATWGRRRDGWA